MAPSVLIDDVRLIVGNEVAAGAKDVAAMAGGDEVAQDVVPAVVIKVIDFYAVPRFARMPFDLSVAPMTPLRPGAEGFVENESMDVYEACSAR